MSSIRSMTVILIHFVTHNYYLIYYTYTHFTSIKDSPLATPLIETSSITDYSSGMIEGFNYNHDVSCH